MPSSTNCRRTAEEEKYISVSQKYLVGHCGKQKCGNNRTSWPNPLRLFKYSPLHHSTTIFCCIYRIDLNWKIKRIWTIEESVAGHTICQIWLLWVSLDWGWGYINRIFHWWRFAHSYNGAMIAFCLPHKHSDSDSLCPPMLITQITEQPFSWAPVYQHLLNNHLYP